MIGRLASGLFLAGLLAGCGGPRGPVAVEPAPHGGTLAPLPDGKGHLELLMEPDPAKSTMARLTVFYLDAGRKPMAAPPTSAKLSSPDVGPTPLDLKPVEGGGPAKAGGLVSPPFRSRGEIVGEVTATIDGQSVVAPINIR